MALRTLTGAKFACFTGTKVQILTRSSSLIWGLTASPEGKIAYTTHFTCFTGTKVQIPTQKALA